MLDAELLDQMLADGRRHIGGALPGHGDLALYANLWFIKSMPFAAEFAAITLASSAVAAWFGRMAAIGHGMCQEASADDAIAAARKRSGTVHIHFLRLGQIIAPA